MLSIAHACAVRLLAWPTTGLAHEHTMVVVVVVVVVVEAPLLAVVWHCCECLERQYMHA
jgi:hypothetical protein